MAKRNISFKIRLISVLFFAIYPVFGLHELCGCETESVLKDHIQKNGQSYDVTVQFMSREKWMSVKDKMEYQPVDFENEQPI